MGSAVRAAPATSANPNTIVATATAPLVLGRPVLTSLSTSLDPPLLGPIYASTTLLFDIGVYMVVIGLVFMLFEAFGDESADPT